ncbi:hypothetical protein PCANC_09287 [Puccinia coronata f. sp. avenae]|uniref:Uncharacterized protein n=1 Tax=Puccinia coronata f. sp. avenae TaxID=200324 RepID=A0A2N5UUY2_9BASI|nr:hypothetical protein PCANC_09287 [Puccinia coronata f. sp. avenae]PLW41457.1 hypothetical protein PCASD_07198 [Puccinia coronata f. sp. avenae]
MSAIIILQGMENSNMASSYDASSQNNNHDAVIKKILTTTSIIAFVCAGALCISSLVGYGVWCCCKKRYKRYLLNHQTDVLTFPPLSHNLPSSPNGIAPEKATCIPDTPLSGGRSSGVLHIVVPDSRSCEKDECDIPLIVAANEPNEPMVDSQDSCTIMKDASASPASWGPHRDLIPGLPQHITFVPKVLLTANPSYLKSLPGSQLTSLRPNPHDKMITKPQPTAAEPKSCKMSPAEALKELEKYIEQVNLGVFDDSDDDDSFLSSNPGTPSVSLPNSSFLPVPFPRYNYQKTTPLRRNPSHLQSTISYSNWFRKQENKVDDLKVANQIGNVV